MKQLHSAGGAIMEAQMVDTNQFRDLQDIWNELKIKKNKSIFRFLLLVTCNDI